MAERMLMKGNEALAEAAIRAGCRFYAGYPITPQSEVPEYMSRRMPEVGGVFIQAESEVATVNMLYGAGGAGARVMTSSSSPGISLMQEGISYMAGAEVPGVFVNMMRGGPGLGDISPSQGDYFQATKGGGHGDYRLIVLAPGSIQEMVELMQDAFDLADKYRNPVMVVGDGMLGQMMEPVTMPPMRDLSTLPAKPWATTGAAGRKKNIINSLELDPYVLEKHVQSLKAKFDQMQATEQRHDTYLIDDAEIVVVAYGTVSRVARSAIDAVRGEGIKAGLFRPITLWPWPEVALARVVESGRVKAFLVAEMSTGQMIEDVRLTVSGRVPVHFYGRYAGVVPTPKELAGVIQNLQAQLK